MEKSTNKLKQLKPEQFMEFFSLIEEKKVNTSIVFISDDIKSMFFLKKGCIVMHKSNLKRQNSLENLQNSALGGELKENMSAQLASLTTFEQWKFLYSNALIDQIHYQTLIEQDCEHILNHHYQAKQTFILKTSSNAQVDSHLQHISLFSVCMKVLKRHVSIESMGKDIEGLKGVIKKIDIFNRYIHLLFAPDKIDAMNVTNTQFLIQPLDQSIWEAFNFLKQQGVIDFEVIKKPSQASQIMLNIDSFEHKNAFEIFNLDSKANPAAIKKRYLEMVAVYHPDKLSALSDEEKKIAEKIFSQITTAYNQISSEEKRKQYIKDHINKKSVQISKEEQETAMHLVEAEILFLEGQGYLKSSKFSQALAAFAQSCSIKEDEKYVVYAAWAQFRLGVADKQQSLVTEARENLKKAVLTDMPMLEALFFLANIEKYLGQLKQAKRYLEQVIERDPYFMTAKIELNLINKRMK